MLMGWAAMTGSLSVGAWALYALLFVWQFPHFLAIAWMYREDYARAGMLMLPTRDPQGDAAFRQILGYSLAVDSRQLASHASWNDGKRLSLVGGSLGSWLSIFCLARVLRDEPSWAPRCSCM